MRCLGGLLACGALTVSAILAPVFPGFEGGQSHAAVDIGVTSAVRPNATGTPPGGEARILHVGLDVTVDERIETGPRGQTHLLFRDGSALTIGPNARMVLDTFVYDPVAKQGELVVSVSKGLFRFVGGRLSKKKPVLFKTPTAVIGIRGGVAMMDLGAGDGAPSSVTMLFGDEVFMDDGESRQTMNRPGFTITQQPGGGINPPTQASPQQLNSNLTQLEEPVPGEEGGDDGLGLGDIAPAAGGPTVSDQDVSGSQLSNLGSGNDPATVAPSSGTPEPNAGAAQTGTPNGIGEELAEASQQEAMNGGGSAAGGGQSGNEEEDEGGGSTQAGSGSTQDDFGGGTQDGESGSGETIVASGASFASIEGRGRCCGDDATGTDDGTANRNFVLTDASVTDGVLTATGDNGSFSLIFPGSGSHTLTAADGTGTIFNAFPQFQSGRVFVSTAGDFAAYELRNDINGSIRGLVIAGVPTAAEAFPETGFSSYSVLDDFTLANGPLASQVPFVDDINSAGIASDSAEAYVAWDGSAPNGHSAFGIGRVVVIGNQAATQESGVSVFAGSVVMGEAAGGFISAAMRGGSHQSGGFGGNSQYFGNANSLPTGTGEHFFGSAGPENFLLGGATAGRGGDPVMEAVQYRNGGIVAAAALYPNSVGVNGNHTSGAPSSSRTAQTLKGYAGGLFINHIAGNGTINDVDRLFIESLGSTSPGLEIVTDPTTNRFSVSLDGFDDRDGFAMNFGGLAADQANSAFIDDKIFMAIEDDEGFGDYAGLDFDNGTGYFTTAHDLQTSGLIPTGVSLCSCEYLTWGFLGFDTEVAFTNGERRQAHLTTWVAGSPVTNAAQFPGGVTATYQGHVWGTVYNGTDTYQAVGSLTLSVTAVGGGEVRVNSGAISNFDGGTYTLSDDLGGFETTPKMIFSAEATLVSRTGYAAGDIEGKVTGNFFGPESMPENLGGNFYLQKVQGSGDAYKAGGTAMGEKVAQTGGGGA